MDDEIGISIESAFELIDKPTVQPSKKKLNFFQQLNENKPIYSKLIEQLESRLDDVRTKVHDDFIFKMINFILDYESKLSNGDKFELSLLQVAIMSSCLTEFDFIIDLFINKLGENGLTNVIHIKSNDKITLEKIVEQIYEKLLTDDLLENQLKVDDKKKFLKTLRFSTFGSIFEKYLKNQPVILIIDDLISINHEVINQLFELLHKNLYYDDDMDDANKEMRKKRIKLPILVFCGLSEAYVSLQSLIRPKILNRICISSFVTKNSFQIFDEVFNSTFINSDLSIKFGSEFLTHLIDIFIHYDNSIERIGQLTKLAIWDFCRSNEFVHLNGTEEEFAIKLDNLNRNELIKLSKINSMQDFKLGNDLKKINANLILNFNQMNKIQTKFLNELKAIHEIIHFGSKQEHVNFRKLYCKLLSTECDITEDVEMWFTNLKKHQSNEWRNLIENAIQNDLINQTDLVKLLQNQLSKMDEVHEEKVVDQEKKKLSSSHPLARRQQFLATIHLSASKSKIDSSFNNWRKETINLIRDHLYNLQNPSDSPLNELFYYNNVDLIKKFSLVSFREQILNRLVSSDQFVETIKEHTDDRIEKKLFDNFNAEICIAFKLYRESQIKINVADWLQSYMTIMEQNEIASDQNENTPLKRGRKKVKIHLDENDIKSKFFNNILDLGYIGILEREKAKSFDYVTKLIL